MPFTALSAINRVGGEKVSTARGAQTTTANTANTKIHIRNRAVILTKPNYLTALIATPNFLIYYSVSMD